MSAIGEARAALHARLVDGCSALVGATHVHRWVPTQLVTPAVWIGSPALTQRDVGNPGVVLTIVSFPVYASTDGVPPSQAWLLDELIAAVWDASLGPLAEPIDASPQPVDVGGGTLRASLIEVDVTVAARTLCTPDIHTTRTLETAHA
jgi:hypothetical protein